MASRNYERLSIEVFGRHLITSGDLDPVYIALHKLHSNGGWATDQLHRWLVAYWCFYHCGFASHVAGAGDRFWDIMGEAAANDTVPPVGERWPRGSERRHARGKQGIAMVEHLACRYWDDPGNMIRFICAGDVAGARLSFSSVVDRAKVHTLFGPWIGFKIADMVDRVLGLPVDFNQASVFMFKDPVKAAIMLWHQRMNMPDAARPKDQDAVICEIVEYLSDEFSDLLAPPLMDRPIGLQEVETVLCKWKSHMNGHYPLNNDIDEINEGLKGWGQAAEEFSSAMPEAVR